MTIKVSAPSEVLVEVYDVLGRRVAHLYEGALPVGQRMITLDAASLPPGAYAVRVVAGNGAVVVRRVTLVR